MNMKLVLTASALAMIAGCSGGSAPPATERDGGDRKSVV